MQRMSHVLRHRLRNIAAGIRGAVTLIDEEAGTAIPDGLREYFPLMLRECEGLSDIANRLSLFWADPSSATTPAESATMITARLVSEINRRFPNVEVRQRIDGDGMVPDVMTMALREVLVNACEAAPRGIVGIALKPEGQQIGWTVSDTGNGVPDANREQAFLPFFTTKPKHLGLGLSLARRHCQRAGGDCLAKPPVSNATEWTVALTCAKATDTNERSDC